MAETLNSQMIIHPQKKGLVKSADGQLSWSGTPSISRHSRIGRSVAWIGRQNLIFGFGGTNQFFEEKLPSKMAKHRLETR
jgi:hypothetical protein